MIEVSKDLLKRSLLLPRYQGPVLVSAGKILSVVGSIIMVEGLPREFDVGVPYVSLYRPVAFPVKAQLEGDVPVEGGYYIITSGYVEHYMAQRGFESMYRLVGG